ncbi:polysaccharide deacetylase family sporulation protein PdaB [Clostridium collagenovorans DSM 3089]|uniref:Polysaccharide deacetylase family sporulation protein PdaB n=1 Tax=Clostridium collagenovorans DSM 3089 TaxID=1121306 RepID=A0A1M5VT77_9CLOT|nr:polysaccharide deacetylase family sporulation protein PdaB [Clostridium collagenovorans]SHH78456.1 polysaccharide deacetylase family sporulation protein PdaB [Clostridium collagenovorans DSM 3089]
MKKLEPKHTKLLFLSIALVVVMCVGVVYNYKTVGALSNATTKKLPIYSTDVKDKKVAITFDTSWGTDYTKEILNVLEKQDVKATFFVIGTWIDDYKEETKEIHSKGHELGNHSNTHPDMTKISKDKMINEVAVTDAKIMEITGERPTLFRCPSGSYNDEVIKNIEETNHKIIQWDTDSIDWKEKGAEEEYNRVVEKVKPGSIILFHNNAKYTPENLEKIITKLKGEGYEFVKVSDMIYKDDYYLDHTGKQIKNSNE